MAAQLAGTVYVTDPDTHQTVTLAPGTSPEPRLAALVTNPAAWVDGKLPRLPNTKTGDPSEGSAGPTGNGQDDVSGDTSDASGTADQSTEANPVEGEAAADTKPAAKTAAKKTAARKPAAT